MKKFFTVFLSSLMVCCTIIFTSCSNDSDSESSDKIYSESSDKIYLVIVMVEIQKELGFDGPTWFKYVDYEGDDLYDSFIIDSNPTDSKLESTQTLGIVMVSTIIPAIHEKCGIPAYVWTEMKRTTALDGMQTYNIKNLSIAWTYHPNNGLEVLYFASY